MAVHTGFPIVTGLAEGLESVTPGTVTASKAVLVDANKDIDGFRHVTIDGSIINGNTDGATVKGIYVSGTIAVAVPTIADAEIDEVAVDISAMTFAAAVGDAVIAIPLEALMTSAILCGAWVSATDQVTVSFAAKEGGAGVTGANKNFKFLILDLT